MHSNARMCKSDWKQRFEALALTLATLTTQWSAARAERKRLTYTVFKIRQKLEEIETLAASINGSEALAIFKKTGEAIELTMLTTAGIGKKSAKKEGLEIP